MTDEEMFFEKLKDCYDYDWKDEWGEYKKDCFEFNFPITLVFANGTTSTADTEDALKEIYEIWETTAGDDEVKPTFQYPFYVTYEDGETATVTDEEMYFDLLKDCF